MISSAEEFVRLRSSEIQEEYHLAAHDSADISIWLEVIERFPDYKVWVVHNKTIPIEILELLATDPNEVVRCAVARKRKINDRIVEQLSTDPSEGVRYALMSNTKLSQEKKKLIVTKDSKWLKKQLYGILQKK